MRFASMMGATKSEVGLVWVAVVLLASNVTHKLYYLIILNDVENARLRFV